MRKLIVIGLLVSLATLTWGQAQVSDKPTKENHARDRWTSIGAKPVSIDVSRSSRTVGWRFTHDGKVLKSLPSYCGGETWSQDNICECKSFEHCLKVIQTKKLTVTEEQQERLDEIQDEVNREAREARAR